jgi:hypothetical protein
VDRARRNLIHRLLHSRRSRLALLGLAVGLFLWGAWRQGTSVNNYLHASDQFEYLTYAKNMARTQFAVVGPRSRMPLYPALMAGLWREGMTDDEFFRLGKRVGIVLALLMLGVAYVVFRAHASAADATVATAVAAFTMAVYKAPYFQCELLFYGAALILLAAMLSLLERPRDGVAAAVGVTAGVTHLIKASVLPALVVCVAALLLRGVLSARRARADRAAAQPATRGGAVLRHLRCAALVVACFLLVVAPYLRTSKRVFGRYFYNVTTTFYMWCDSWEEAKSGTRAHGDEVGWPDLPPESIPSFGRYLREHGPVEIASRLAGGLGTTLREAFGSYGYAWFVLAYVFAAVSFGRRGGDRASPPTAAAPRIAERFFIASYFAGYLLLYAWYAPIASGNRFVLALMMPLLLVSLRQLSRAQDRGAEIELGGRRLDASEVGPLLFALLLVYVVVALPLQISTVYGGT